MIGLNWRRAAAATFVLTVVAGQGSLAAARDWGFTSGFQSHDRYARYNGGEFAAEDFSGCGCWRRDHSYGPAYFGRGDEGYGGSGGDAGPGGPAYGGGPGYAGPGPGPAYGDGPGQPDPNACRHFDPTRGYYVTNWQC